MGEHPAHVARADGRYPFAVTPPDARNDAALAVAFASAVAAKFPSASSLPASRPHDRPPYLVMRPEQWQWWLTRYGPYIRRTPR